ncbi:MAG: hypothetical protein ACYC65_10645 [Candidatus Limnocylindrales bacterium]
MDQSYLLVLAIAVIAALAALGAIRVRPRRSTTPDGTDSPFGVSTEGMKVCPKCGMGNLWTDRTCMSCQAPLRG